MGGGREIWMRISAAAIVETGTKITEAKNTILKINFFIGLPPLSIIYPTAYRPLRSAPTITFVSEKIYVTVNRAGSFSLLKAPSGQPRMAISCYLKVYPRPSRQALIARK
jgi:hypothetical protein